MLRPTVSRPVCLGLSTHLGLTARFFYYCQTIAGLLMWGALSDERTGLSFTMYNVHFTCYLALFIHEPNLS
jgi:hypothetical protein